MLNKYNAQELAKPGVAQGKDRVVALRSIPGNQYPADKANGNAATVPTSGMAVPLAISVGDLFGSKGNSNSFTFSIYIYAQPLFPDQDCLLAARCKRCLYASPSATVCHWLPR